MLELYTSAQTSRQNESFSILAKNSFPVGRYPTRKLKYPVSDCRSNIHKTPRRRPGRPPKALCATNTRAVPMGHMEQSIQKWTKQIF